MDLTEKLKKILSERYGINSDEELMQAAENETRADIGIFVSPCGNTLTGEKKRMEYAS